MVKNDICLGGVRKQKCSFFKTSAPRNTPMRSMPRIGIYVEMECVLKNPNITVPYNIRFLSLGEKKKKDLFNLVRRTLNKTTKD